VIYLIEQSSTWNSVLKLATRGRRSNGSVRKD
jgi:hypothetical protein